MMNAPSGMLTSKPQRMLGFDFWRFFGSFLVFVIHNVYVIQIAAAANPEIMTANSLLERFTHPTLVTLMGSSAVPMFLFLSGYFTLGRPVRENDWDKCKKGFWKYLIYYWKWLVVALVIYLVFPNLFYTGNALEGLSAKQIAIYFLRNLTNVSNVDGVGVVGPVALNWFIIVMAWLMLLTPFLKGVVQSGNIKMVRTLTFVLAGFTMVPGAIRAIGANVLLSNPDSTLGWFMNGFYPLYTVSGGFTLGTHFVAIYLMGGWFAVDTALQERIKNMKWSMTTVVAAVLFLVEAWYTQLGSTLTYPADAYWITLDWYDYGGWIFGTAMFVLVAFKLNDTITADSKIGKFTTAFSSDTLGVMIAGWMFGPYQMGKVFVPIVTNMVNTLWNPSFPILLTLAWLLFNFTYWFCVLILVHFVKKIPFVGKLFVA